MNNTLSDEWKAAWSTEQPTPVFVDEVMRAVERGSVSLLTPQLSKRRPAQWLAVNGVAVATSVALVAAAGIYLRSPSSGQTAPNASNDASAAISMPNVGTEPMLEATAAQGAERGLHSAGALDTPRTSAPARRTTTVSDSGRRESAKARLHSLYVPGVERDPHTGLTLPEGEPPPGEGLTPAYIQERMRKDFFPLAGSCYDAALAKQPRLTGTIVLDFMIVAEPNVGAIVDQAKINAATDIQDLEFQECMLGSMLSLVFDAGDSGGWVTITHPFEFRPEPEP